MTLRMNPALELLRPYPFERLRALLAPLAPPPDRLPINLSIGEPKHPTPRVLLEALAGALPTLANYPATKGTDALREAIAGWLMRRYRLRRVDPQTQVLPVNGSREALFAFAQATIDAHGNALVLVPNPGYQIYEGAALLAGAQLRYLPTTRSGGWRMPLERVSAQDWQRVRLVYACSPGNPTGHVMSLQEWQELFALADRHDFLIAADECYSEIYFDEAQPPLGALEAAERLGRTGFARLVCFSSLSKRSNAPGLRSGFVAGDARALERFLAYRTYHGCAMSPATQAASIAAWNDESHVIDNRRRYAGKFAQAQPRISRVLPAAMPQAAFYLWAQTPGDDAHYASTLYAEQNVLVLPGSFLARTVEGTNPGAGYVRIALVADEAQVVAATERILAHAAQSAC
ncbi:N-succinyldiaminopimelate aminotransferase [Burkholderiales bacterium]|nr:N-succinyldiaminopimelate aminotransferase [Burkholderiales bacterium]